MSTGKIYDHQGKLIRRVHVDEAEGVFHMSSEQDLTAVIDQNKMLRENQTGKEQFRLVARVPVDTVERAMREGWWHDDNAWAKWLNDSDNRDHRVHQGRV